MLKKVLDGISAGILISIGGSVFLACFSDNKYIGAVLFSVALLFICLKGYSLFTGKIGYLVDNHTKNDFAVTFLGLLGNAIATCLLGMAIRYALPNLGEIANTICTAKLNQEFLQTLIRSIFCGILMYLAVSAYREGKGISGIFFAVPVFILSGFEHSIANMFYFGASGIFSLKAFGYILLVILGNSIGGMLLPAIDLLGRKESAK